MIVLRWNNKVVRHGELRTQKQHFLADLLYDAVIVNIFDYFLEEAGDDVHLLFLHPSGGDSRCSESQAAGVKRRCRICRNGVVIGDDSGPVKSLCKRLSRDSLVA